MPDKVTIVQHLEHGPWVETKGDDVFCGCGARLYQGQLPESPDERRQMAQELDAAFAALDDEDRERDGP